MWQTPSETDSEKDPRSEVKERYEKLLFKRVTFSPKGKGVSHLENQKAIWEFKYELRNKFLL